MRHQRPKFILSIFLNIYAKPLKYLYGNPSGKAFQLPSFCSSSMGEVLSSLIPRCLQNRCKLTSLPPDAGLKDPVLSEESTRIISGSHIGNAELKNNNNQKPLTSKWVCSHKHFFEGLERRKLKWGLKHGLKTNSLYSRVLYNNYLHMVF